ncbi:MAG: PAQR family membrane homeostasis protein TrhA, partial [Nocardioidaceae bacterium]
MTAKTASATPKQPATAGDHHHLDLGVRISGAFRPLKPKLRGWLHAGTFPLATAAGIVLICLAPSAAA